MTNKYKVTAINKTSTIYKTGQYGYEDKPICSNSIGSAVINNINYSNSIKGGINNDNNK